MSHETEPTKAETRPPTVAEEPKGETEAAAEESPLKRSWSAAVFTLTLPLVIAAFTFVGTALGTAFKGFLDIRLQREKFTANRDLELDKFNSNRKLENERFRVAMIQKATENGAPADKIKSLKFLVNTGIIDDPGGKILAYTEEDVPTLYPVNAPATAPIVGDGWIFVGTYANKKWSDRTVTVTDGKLPQVGDVLDVRDDVYLRVAPPTKDHQLSDITKTVLAKSKVQVVDIYPSPKSDGSDATYYWCRVSLSTDGATAKSSVN